MYFDESLWIKGGEARILFISPPQGKKLQYVL
jgi:hypothetical protein